MFWKIDFAFFIFCLVLQQIRMTDSANGFKCHKCTGDSCDDPFSAKSKGVSVEECSLFEGKPMCMKAISKGTVTRQCMKGISCTLHGADTYRAWCCDQPFCNHSTILRPDGLFVTFLLLAVVLQCWLMADS